MELSKLMIISKKNYRNNSKLFYKIFFRKENFNFGVGFKKNTNDSRESASIYITYQLLKLGFKVNIYDPMVSRKKY